MTLETDLIAAQEPGSAQLMVVLHGLGDSMEGYRGLPGALRLPKMNYLLVNAPDPYVSGFSWYDFSQDSDPGIRRSRQLLFELLEELPSRGFRLDQVFLFGFSQGCVMTLDVGLRYPSRFAGLIGISGYVHQPESLLRELSPAASQQRLLVTHGTEDPLIPLKPVREQIQSLKQHGIRIDWHEFPKAHGIAGEDELQVIREFVFQ